MKLKTKNVVTALILSVTAIFSSIMITGCGGDNSEKKPDSSYFENAPDYSSSDKKVSLYAYAPPGNGVYTIDGKSYQATDENGNPVTFQTVEKYREYKDCGFDTIMFQADDPYRGEAFETSHIKDLLDMAQEVGLRAIMFDTRLHNLSASEKPIVGKGCTITDADYIAYVKSEGIDVKYSGSNAQMETQEDLNEYVRYCMKDYSEHPAFYGLLLRDEPTYKMLPALGAVIKGIKSIKPDCLAQCNLFPLHDGKTYQYYKEDATEDTILSSYKWYIEEFLNQSGSDYVMMDSYPMTVESGNSIIKGQHIKGMQIIADVCKEKGVDFYMVIQSSSWSNNGVRKTRAVLEEDLYWQWYTCLGMGVKQISYFTYQRKRTNVTTGEYFDDGTSFITSNGEKTPLYTWAENVHSEMQNLVKVVFNFDYVGLRSYVGIPSPCNIGFLQGLNETEFKKISKVKTSEGSVLLVTEMYDKTKNRYGYMIINAADPQAEASLIAEVAFTDAKAVSVYSDGKNEQKMLNDDGSIKFMLTPGRAVFVLPY